MGLETERSDAEAARGGALASLKAAECAKAKLESDHSLERTHLQTRLDQAERRPQQLEQQLETVESQLAHTERSHAHLEDKLLDVQGKRTELEGQVQALTRTLARLRRGKRK